MKLKLTAAVIVSILVTGCASNNGKHNPQGRESITSLLPGGTLLIGFNRNDDYVIDRTEFAEGRVKAFEAADRNGNGAINLTEFRSWQPKATGSISALPNLVYFDRNFNDQITQTEFDVGMEKLFHDADHNKDNKLSYQELVTMVSPPQAKKGKSGSGGRGGGSGKGQRGGGKGGGNRPTNF